MFLNTDTHTSPTHAWANQLSTKKGNNHSRVVWVTAADYVNTSSFLRSATCSSPATISSPGRWNIGKMQYALSAGTIIYHDHMANNILMIVYIIIYRHYVPRP